MRTVLHVLPHPGGGGETYVDLLSVMDGYQFDRFYLSSGPSARESLRTLPLHALEVHAKALKYDVIHVEGEIAGAICLPSLALRPSVVTLNGLHLLRRVRGAGLVAAKTNLRLMLRAASRVICVSESERDDLLEAVGGRSADRAVLIRNGIAPLPTPSADERRAARTEMGLGEGVVAAAWLAGLDEHKDPRTAVLAALEVARSGAPFALLMAGDGPLRGELEQTVAQSETDAVRILGFRRDAHRVLAAADFFVLSSQREGLSFSLLEAMSIGLPAVVSDGPGNPDAVADAGVVVPSGDVQGFAAAFRQLIHDEGTRARLGALARERVRSRFGVDEMARRTRAVYNDVVAERRGW